MAWTDPDVSWADGDQVDGATFDALMENIAWLKHHSFVYAQRDTNTVLSATSATTIHSSLELTMTNYGGPVLFGLYLNGVGGGGVAVIRFDVQDDGGSVEVGAGYWRPTGTAEDTAFIMRIFTPAAGSNVLRWVYDNESAANNPTINPIIVFAIELGTP